jgi:PKD repeat protein
MKHAFFTIMLFWVLTFRAEGQAFGAFTNKYGAYGTNFIRIAPWTAQGIFYQGDPVTISNNIGTTVEVFDFHGARITNAAPPVTLTTLKLGHYFVQVDGKSQGFGDRSQFSVWPKGYTNYPHADIGEPNTGTVSQSNRFVRIAPGFSRLAGTWSTIVSNSSSRPHTNDWTLFDEYLHGGYIHTKYNTGSSSMVNTPVSVKVLNIWCEHIPGITLSSYSTSEHGSPYVDETNSLTSFINDFSSFCSNTAMRYTNAFVYEVLNEPNYTSLVFPDDPFNSGGAYPASLAVSASVRAIKFVCPTCQVWAPAATTGLRPNLALFTNSYARAGYTNVNLLCYHAYDTLYGPVDSTLAFTGSVLIANGDGNTWLPIDAAQNAVSSIYGKPFAITEAGPFSPDVLGKSNSWWLTQARVWAVTNASDAVIGGYASLPWTWQTMTFRFWKYLLAARATGLSRVQAWCQIYDQYPMPGQANMSYEGGDSYSGWDAYNDTLGCGPNPSVDGQAMISWWLTGATPVMHWLSGGPLLVVDPQGGYTHGTPGLHFWSWQFADGNTNTFIWADEQTTVGTNLGVGLTDIFSNQWTQPVGMEPVIAWGWPNNRLGAAFSVVPAAAFLATPTNGPAILSVTFTDRSAGAITSRSWRFGDGFVTNTAQLTVVHQYTAPGSNTVQLIVSGPSGVSTNTQFNMVIVTPLKPSQNNGGSNGVPPGNAGNTGGTNDVPRAGGGSNSNWRTLITY